MMKALSVKQKNILDYIKRNIEEKGFPPSIREIAEEVGLSSTSTVAGHLIRLEKKGYIKRIPDTSRAITIQKTIKDC
ncbi:MAG: winged helix-turn-helix transcriptional regulator [Clostridiales bacterium]|nr:winged helix-turn-helix transcriptional regulator [Clostridiales bacterium]